MRWFTAIRQIVTSSIFKGTRLHVKSNPSNMIVLESSTPSYLGPKYDGDSTLSYLGPKYDGAEGKIYI